MLELFPGLFLQISAAGVAILLAGLLLIRPRWSAERDDHDSGEDEAPSANRECLHCHENVLSFRQHAAHQAAMAKRTSGEVSCLLCHGRVHDVEQGEVRAAVTGERRFTLPVEVEQQGGARWLR